jgi:predicted deacetylase
MIAAERSSALAVAVHDVEQGSFGRVVEIRQWLAEHGVDRVTLLVIPAAHQRPIGMHAPLALWLRNRVAHGDAVAQHGFSHRVVSSPHWSRKLLAHWQAGEAAEFPGLGGDQAARRVASGRRVLGDLDLDPHGFVAPGYAYTPELRSLLVHSFDWFADLRGIRTRREGEIRARALCLGTSTSFKRIVSPTAVRALSVIPGEVMRIDVHPADFDHPLHVATLEWLLERAARRQAVTYDELID